MPTTVTQAERAKRENQLLSVLDRARMTMEAVDSGNYEKGNISIEGDDIKVLNKPVNQPPKQTLRNLNESKLPKEIIDSFVNNPIPKPTYKRDFTIPEETLERARKINERIRDEEEDEREGEPQYFSTQQRLKERVREKAAPIVDKQELYKMIREVVEEVIADVFDKRVIKEEIQLKVGNTIFSGNLSPLPKVKNK